MRAGAHDARSASARTRPVRVLHLITGLGRGGAETLLADGHRFADRTRFAYGYAYLLPGKDAVAEDLRQQGAEVFQLGGRPRLLWLPALLRTVSLLRRWRADVLHCHLPVAGLIGRVAGRLTRTPVVYTEHNVLEIYHPLSRWADRATWRLQRSGIAVSQEVADSVRRHVRRTGSLRIIRNGIDLGRIEIDAESRLAGRTRFGLDAEAFVVGTVAVLRPQKRLDDWIRALAKLREWHPKARGLIVGDGPSRSGLEDLASRLGVSEHVIFAGLQTRVPELLGAMDVFLMTSQAEGLPLALLEAMAARLPIVATAVGGIPEVVQDGETGFLGPVGRPTELAEALSRLATDRELRGRLGAAGMRRVRDLFDIRRMQAELEDVYLGSCGA